MWKPSQPPNFAVPLRPSNIIVLFSSLFWFYGPQFGCNVSVSESVAVHNKNNQPNSSNRQTKVVKSWWAQCQKHRCFPQELSETKIHLQMKGICVLCLMDINRQLPANNNNAIITSLDDILLPVFPKWPLIKLKLILVVYLDIHIVLSLFCFYSRLAGITQKDRYKMT